MTIYEPHSFRWKGISTDKLPKQRTAANPINRLLLVIRWLPEDRQGLSRLRMRFLTKTWSSSPQIETLFIWFFLNVSIGNPAKTTGNISVGRLEQKDLRLGRHRWPLWSAGFGTRPGSLAEGAEGLRGYNVITTFIQIPRISVCDIISSQSILSCSQQEPYCIFLKYYCDKASHEPLALARHCSESASPRISPTCANVELFWV